MRVLDIAYQTGSDGPGMRNALYMAGCAHHCVGCHNPQSWDPQGGEEWEIGDIVEELIDPFSDITITGGDPFYQAPALLELLKALKAKAPQKNIWVYTGYTIEEIYPDPVASSCLEYIDVLVDGRYIESQRDLSRFCGSRNQRILYLEHGKVVREE